MLHLNIHEIKTHLSSYLERVAGGETLIICKRNVPIAELKPIQRKLHKKRPIGLAGKTYPDFKIDAAFSILCRMIFYPPFMEKKFESTARHLHFSLACTGQ